MTISPDDFPQSPLSESEQTVFLNAETHSELRDDEIRRTVSAAAQKREEASSLPPRPMAYQPSSDSPYPHYHNSKRYVAGNQIRYVMGSDWGGANTPANFQMEAAREEELFLAEQVARLIAAEPGEFLLHSESGDEWFEVARQDGTYRSGDLVSVDRGNVLVLSFNAIHCNSRETPGYACSGTAEILASGELRIHNNVFPASRERIILHENNGNLIRFDRADAVGK